MYFGNLTLCNKYRRDENYFKINEDNYSVNNSIEMNLYQDTWNEIYKLRCVYILTIYLTLKYFIWKIGIITENDFQRKKDHNYCSRRKNQWQYTVKRKKWKCERHKNTKSTWRTFIVYQTKLGQTIEWNCPSKSGN